MLNELHFMAHLTVCRSTSVTVLTLFLFDMLFYGYFAVLNRIWRVFYVGSHRGDDVIIRAHFIGVYFIRAISSNCKIHVT